MIHIYQSKRIVWGIIALAFLFLSSCQDTLLLKNVQVAVAEKKESGTIITPTIVPAGGTYTSDQQVTITSDVTGAVIYFTADGTDPTTASSVYSGPIKIAGEGTNVSIKAIASTSVTGKTKVVTAAYTISYPPGYVFTLAGGGSVGGISRGHADGIGCKATFNGPNGIAVDNSGNVYVADTDNNLIRKITPSGVVTTVAGGWPDGISSGSNNGSGTNARFKSPCGVAIDSSGNIFVARHHLTTKATSICAIVVNTRK